LVKTRIVRRWAVVAVGLAVLCGLPLMVEIFTRGSARPALESQFFQVSRWQPDPRVLTPVRGPGTGLTVTSAGSLAGALSDLGLAALPAELAGRIRQPVLPGYQEIGVYGGGLATFVVLGVRGTAGQNLVQDAVSAGGTPLVVARLLVLDEPGNGLDPRGIRDLRELIIGLNEAGVTVFLSSHLLAEVALFLSTITDSALGSALGALAALVASEVLVTLNAATVVQPYLPTRYWLAWIDFFRQPVFWRDIQRGFGKAFQRWRPGIARTPPSCDGMSAASKPLRAGGCGRSGGVGADGQVVWVRTDR
jgi:hypothetical protein